MCKIVGSNSWGQIGIALIWWLATLQYLYLGMQTEVIAQSCSCPIFCVETPEFSSTYISFLFSSVPFSSRWYLCTQKSPYASPPLSLRSFPNIAFETVPVFLFSDGIVCQLITSGTVVLWKSQKAAWSQYVYWLLFCHFLRNNEVFSK